MPFEPLGTDEPLEESASPRRNSDFESQLMGGCFTILGGSLAIFLLTWWPFVVFDTLSTAGLMKAIGFAAVPALIVGVVITRMVKLAGAVAFAAGMFVGAMFLFLNLNMKFIGINSPDMAQAEYPEAWGWIVPLAWFLAGLCVMLFAYGNPSKTSEGDD